MSKWIRVPDPWKLFLLVVKFVEEEFSFKKNGALLLNNYVPTIPISISSLEKLRKKKGS